MFEEYEELLNNRESEILRVLPEIRKSFEEIVRSVVDEITDTRIDRNRLFISIVKEVPEYVWDYRKRMGILDDFLISLAKMCVVGATSCLNDKYNEKLIQIYGKNVVHLSDMQKYALMSDKKDELTILVRQRGLISLSILNGYEKTGE